MAQAGSAADATQAAMAMAPDTDRQASSPEQSAGGIRHCDDGKVENGSSHIGQAHPGKSTSGLAVMSQTRRHCVLHT